jgi:hypothetical protein
MPPESVYKIGTTREKACAASKVKKAKTTVKKKCRHTLTFRQVFCNQGTNVMIVVFGDFYHFSTLLHRKINSSAEVYS